MDKIVIFGDSSSWVSTILAKATLQEISKIDAMEVVSICDASLLNPGPYPVAVSRIAIKDILIRLFNPEHRFSQKRPLAENLYSVARRFNVKVIVPKERNINHAEFIQRLKDDLKPTICLSYYCVQIFHDKLMEIFEKSVNYHNSLLPQYRGRAATAWSLYHGEKRSGFTFHYITREIDEGNILYQGFIPVTSKSTFSEIEYKKASNAADHIGQVLHLLKNRAAGRSQLGKISYFSRKDMADITFIDDPSAYRLSELQRRLRAFGVIYIKINGREYRVTKLKKTHRASRWFCFGLHFITSDKIMVKPQRLSYLPLTLYRIYRLLIKPIRHIFQ